MKSRLFFTALFLATFTLHAATIDTAGPIFDFALDAKGRKVAIITVHAEEGKARITVYATDTLKPQAEPLEIEAGGLLSFSPDSNLLALDSANPRSEQPEVHIYDWQKREKLMPTIETTMPFPLFSPDGKWLACAVKNGVGFVDLATGRVRRPVTPIKAEGFAGFSSDSKWLLMAPQDDSAISLVNVRTGSVSAIVVDDADLAGIGIDEPDPTKMRAEFSKAFAYCSEKMSKSWKDILTQMSGGTPPRDSRDFWRLMKAILENIDLTYGSPGDFHPISPDGTRCAFCNEQGTVVTDTINGKAEYFRCNQPGWGRISPDNALMALLPLSAEHVKAGKSLDDVPEDSVIEPQIWDLASGEKIATLPRIYFVDDELSKTAWGADSRTFVSITGAKQLTLWKRP